MKKIIVAWIITMISISSTYGDFMYEEIDPICSISGTTHTSFPGEISDTSRWYIPKAYDWECKTTPSLTQKEKSIVFSRVIRLLNKKQAIQEETKQWYTLTPAGQKFVQDRFFIAVQRYIQKEMKKSQPNTKAISILNYAVKIIGYDYFISTDMKGADYTWMSVKNAQKLAKENNTLFRVVKLDGEHQVVTMDYVPGRINATVEKWIVVSYSVE